jgi:hypothetical protein
MRQTLVLRSFDALLPVPSDRRTIFFGMGYSAITI